MAIRHVLIVEDNGPSRRLLASLAACSGWRVIEAGSVAEGLEGLEPPPDCAILDLVLPDGDGETVLRKIREADVPIPVIVVVSAVSDRARLSRIADLRPDLMVQKPLDWDMLWRYCETKMRQMEAGGGWRHRIRVVPTSDAARVASEIEAAGGVDVSASGNPVYGFRTAAERDRVLGRVRSIYGWTCVRPEDGWSGPEP
jgi:DNA-binding response OmpR family regulator